MLGRDAGAALSIYDSNGNWFYSLGDERAFVPIEGTYRSPALPAGTYYAMVEPDYVQGGNTGACPVYAKRRCPDSTSAQALLAAAPTPIVIVDGEDRGGVEFTLVLDGVFSDGFERGSGAATAGR